MAGERDDFRHGAHLVDAANDAGLLSMILDKRATTLLEKQAALMRLAGEP